MTGKHLLDQIVRGLDGVTAGPWVVKETTVNGIGYGGHWLEVADENQDICISGSGGAKSYTQRVVDTQLHDDNEANLRHFARCSPDAIREIAAYVRETEARATAAEATVTALQEALAKAAEALEPFAKEADIYDPPNGDDAHAAWSGDFPIGSLRRARTALSQIRSEK